MHVLTIKFCRSYKKDFEPIISVASYTKMVYWIDPNGYSNTDGLRRKFESLLW